jgi:hypothetical protein
MAVIHNPYAGKYAEDLRQLWEAGAELGERLTPELKWEMLRELVGGPCSSLVIACTVFVDL